MLCKRCNEKEADMDTGYCGPTCEKLGTKTSQKVTVDQTWALEKLVYMQMSLVRMKNIMTTNDIDIYTKIAKLIEDINTLEGLREELWLMLKK